MNETKTESESPKEIDDLSTHVAQAILAFHSVVPNEQYDSDDLRESQVADIIRCILSPETCVRPPNIPISYDLKPGNRETFMRFCREAYDIAVNSGEIGNPARETIVCFGDSAGSAHVDMRTGELIQDTPPVSAEEAEWAWAGERNLPDNSACRPCQGTGWVKGEVVGDAMFVKRCPDCGGRGERKVDAQE